MKKFQLWWTSQDKQGSIDCGTYDTREQAEAAIESTKAEMITEALEDGEGEGLMTKSAVTSGSWSVEEVGE